MECQYTRLYLFISSFLGNSLNSGKIADDAGTHVSISLSLVFCKVKKIPSIGGNTGYIADNASTHVHISLSLVFCIVEKFALVKVITHGIPVHTSPSLYL
jgi:hypothetical protein